MQNNVENDERERDKFKREVWTINLAMLVFYLMLEIFIRKYIR